MFFLRRPSAETIARYLADQSGAEYDYDQVGLTRNNTPDSLHKSLSGSWALDHNRVDLGHGAETFSRAKACLARWEMFDLGWVNVLDRNAPIKVGTVATVIARALGLWSISFARIAYTIDEPDRFGFGYGTLAQHVETGEERFLVGHDPQSNVVYFELLAFSKPCHPLARLGYPFTRLMQKRFARDAKQRMKSGVAHGKTLHDRTSSDATS